MLARKRVISFFTDAFRRNPVLFQPVQSLLCWEDVASNVSTDRPRLW